MSTQLADLAAAREMSRSGLGRRIRLLVNLSHREVGRAVGASASSVYRWEMGQRVPRSAAGLRWAAEMRRLIEERP